MKVELQFILSFCIAVEPKSSASIRKFKILGEVLLILRPFLYVMMIRRHGLRSWRPWLSALAIDATGMAILYGSTLFPDYVFGNKSIPRCVPSKQEKNEVSRNSRLFLLISWVRQIIVC